MSSRISADHIRLKRAYEPPASDDGIRMLIDRLWPRGVKKTDVAIDEWMKEIAPSNNCESGSAMILNAGRSSG